LPALAVSPDRGYWLSAGFSIPFPKPDVRLSPHPAFQLRPHYSRSADQTRCLCVSGTHQGVTLRDPRQFCNFPVRSVDSCFDATAGTPFAILSVAMSLLPGGPSPWTPHYRASFGYYAASAILPARWHFRVCCAGWSPGTDTAVEDFPHSPCPDDRTRSCLLHAGWIGDNAFGVRRPNALHRTVLVQVIQPLHLFCVTALTQVSHVSIGSGFDTQPRSARSRCSLSAGFPPYPLRKDNAGRSTLTSLS